MMLTPDLTQRLERGSAFLASFDPHGKTPRQFWDAYYAEVGDLHDLAFSVDADPEFAQRFMELHHAASEVYGGPEDTMDQVM